MVSPEEIRRAGLGVSGRSISFLTSAQRLQVARADTLLPREKRAFFLQRVVFHLRPAFAVAPSDADVEAAIAAARRGNSSLRYSCRPKLAPQRTEGNEDQ